MQGNFHLSASEHASCFSQVNILSAPISWFSFCLAAAWASSTKKGKVRCRLGNLPERFAIFYSRFHTFSNVRYFIISRSYFMAFLSGGLSTLGGLRLTLQIHTHKVLHFAGFLNLFGLFMNHREILQDFALSKKFETLLNL